MRTALRSRRPTRPGLRPAAVAGVIALLLTGCGARLTQAQIEALNATNSGGGNNTNTGLTPGVNASGPSGTNGTPCTSPTTTKASKSSSTTKPGKSSSKATTTTSTTVPCTTATTTGGSSAGHYVAGSAGSSTGGKYDRGRRRRQFDRWRWRRRHRDQPVVRLAARRTRRQGLPRRCTRLGSWRHQQHHHRRQHCHHQRSGARSVHRRPVWHRGVRGLRQLARRPVRPPVEGRRRRRPVRSGDRPERSEQHGGQHPVLRGVVLAPGLRHSRRAPGVPTWARL